MFSQLICLYIYVFYRTEHTLVNRLFIRLFSIESYHILKSAITAAVPSHDYIIYSLPEGLWVFCITITSGFFYLEVGKRTYSLVFVPVLIAVMMEVFQLIHFLNGRFDWMDIIVSGIFWMLALFCLRANTDRKRLFQSFTPDMVYCIISYSIVYLAHVVPKI